MSNKSRRSRTVRDLFIFSNVMAANSQANSLRSGSICFHPVGGHFIELGPLVSCTASSLSQSLLAAGNNGMHPLARRLVALSFTVDDGGFGSFCAVVRVEKLEEDIGDLVSDGLVMAGFELVPYGVCLEGCNFWTFFGEEGFLVTVVLNSGVLDEVVGAGKIGMDE